MALSKASFLKLPPVVLLCRFWVVCTLQLINQTTPNIPSGVPKQVHPRCHKYGVRRPDSAEHELMECITGQPPLTPTQSQNSLSPGIALWEMSVTKRIRVCLRPQSDSCKAHWIFWMKEIRESQIPKGRWACDLSHPNIEERRTSFTNKG